MSVVGPIVVLFVVFLCSFFRSPLSPFFCFITMIQWWGSGPLWGPNMFVIWNRIRFKVSYRTSKTVIRPLPPPQPSPPPPSSVPRVVFLVTFQRLFCCCSVPLFVCLWFHIVKFIFFFICSSCLSPSLDASGRPCFVFMAFPGYIHFSLVDFTFSRDTSL